MRSKFVTTRNHIRLIEAISALEQRGASESCLIVVDGVPGLGKTTSLNHWCVQNACVFLRAKSNWTSSWFLTELLRALQKEPPRSIPQKFEMVIEALLERQSRATAMGKLDAIVFDEADHFSNKKLIMETARDISDITEVPIIFVGMGHIRNNLNRFPQIASRVSRYVQYETNTLDDVSKLIDEICEVRVSPEMKKFVHQISRGWNREVLDAIANMERFGLRNPPADMELGLKISEMAGEVICNDRHQRKEITVPGNTL